MRNEMIEKLEKLLKECSKEELIQIADYLKVLKAQHNQ